MSGKVIHFPRPEAPEPYLSRTQLAELLDMSERWVDYKVADGMPSHRFGRRRKFKLSEVEPWLQSMENGEAA